MSQPLSIALNATLSDLRDEITRHLANADLDGQMPQLIHRVAQQARIDGLRAEEVVVAFRRVWEDLPDAGDPSASERDTIRWTMVGALLTAYYDGDPRASR